jgi:hypothetical protein
MRENLKRGDVYGSGYGSITKSNHSTISEHSKGDTINYTQFPNNILGINITIVLIAVYEITACQPDLGR